MVAVLGAVLLAMWGLKDRAAYFYTPSDVAAGKASPGKRDTSGRNGRARDGEAEADGITTRFIVDGRRSRVPVRYRGILPNLFREGSGMVAEGELAADRSFVADNILAKHDERYMPPELGNRQRSTKRGRR